MASDCEPPCSPSLLESPPPAFSSVYLPLAANHTRFLTIYPRSCLEDNLYCKLEAIDLNDDAVTSYKALSYTWGSGEFPCAVSVNGFSVPITVNLFDALRYLRDEHQPRTIWADAICINQSDLAERSSQVLLMGRIYSTVRRVVIWLGTEIEGGDLGLRLLADTSKAPLLKTDEIRSAIGTLFERSWWSRSWTIQEFFNVQDRIFVCGYITLDWDAMNRILQAFAGWQNSIDIDRDYSHFFSFASGRAYELKNLLLD
jgi:hypothetical protein